MENSHIPTKRKMASEITENFEDFGVIKRNKGNGVRSLKFSINEIRGDLFASPESASLVHCVSQDLRMGKGIAVTFKSKFGGMQELQEQGRQVGDFGVLKRNGRFIYYLITKERYSHQPTYINLRLSLAALKKHAIANNVTCLAMPKIGCGLDGLDWKHVRDIITDIFKDTDIEISIYIRPV